MGELKREFNSVKLIQLQHSKEPSELQQVYVRKLMIAIQKLLDDFGGQVPSDIDELTSLPGVGRKTANVIRGNIFGINSIVVDTHVKRVSTLLGLTKDEDPVKIEFELMKLLPEDQWILYNFQVIAHGRKVCIARRPQCETCILKEVCKHYNRGI